MLESMEGRRAMPRSGRRSRAGRLPRPPDADQQRRDARAPPGDPPQRGRVVGGPRDARTRGDATLVGLRSRRAAGVLRGAERGHDPRARRGARGRLHGEVGAVVPGGAASGILPPYALDAPLTRDGLAEYGAGVGSAAVQVFPTTYSPLRLLAETMRFFAEESCQKCTPCRIGNRALHHLARSSSTARGAMTREKVDEWLLAMEKTSICGLGQAAAVPRARTRCAHWPELFAPLEPRCSSDRRWSSSRSTAKDGQRARGRAARPRGRPPRHVHPHALPRRQARSVRRLPHVRRRRRGRAAADARVRDARVPRAWSSPRTARSPTSSGRSPRCSSPST